MSDDSARYRDVEVKWLGDRSNSDRWLNYDIVNLMFRCVVMAEHEGEMAS